jgi:hypothetical protein
MPASSQLAIVIVTWNVRELALDCLRSVTADFAHSQIKGTVWLVDNASTDGTSEAVRQQFPHTHVIDSGDNIGFAAGNNLALRALGFPDVRPDSPPFVLLLNPDTVIQPGALRALLDGMESTGAGIGGARLTYSDGSFQHSTFAFPGLAQLLIDLFPVPARLHESRINGRYPRSLYQAGAPFQVDFPLGATFLLRREVIQQTGLFDEQFHLYCEEIDWAMRIQAAGWQAVCIPSAQVTHYGGQSTTQVRPQSIRNLWTARLLLFKKHYSPLRRQLAVRIVRAGMRRLIRLTAANDTYSDDERNALIAAYQAVIRAA